MAPNPTQPPWEFLLSASRNSLQSYEFTRLAHAANLRKEISALLNQWLEENAAAMLARWLMDQRERNREADRQAGVASDSASEVQLDLQPELPAEVQPEFQAKVRPDARRGAARHRPPSGRVSYPEAGLAPDRAGLSNQTASDNFFADSPDFAPAKRGPA